MLNCIESIQGLDWRHRIPTTCHLLIGYEIGLSYGRAMKAISPADQASGQKEQAEFSKFVEN